MSTDSVQLVDQVAPSRDRYDVLVVGAGAAGLYAALCLPQQFQVGLITKDTLSLSASDWAQGGIAAAVDPKDSPKIHTVDTLKAGAGLCDPAAVDFLTTHAATCIADLVQLGVMFDRQDGHLALTLEAAHSHRRVLHAADTTGRAVVSTLTAEVLTRPNIQVIDQAFVLDLWLSANGTICDGVVLAWRDRLHWLPARAVVLATGGGGQVFAHTTNPALSTGDGVAIASRAGAILRDLEFIQFHPTALTQPGAPHFLISEAVRGEGAHLVDDQGERFAFRYHPAGELAPRDVVSRAIFTHLQQTAPNPATATVWLDLRPIPPDTIRHRFPNIIQVCQKSGIDVFHAPIPVAPAAHYWMGGIGTNLDNSTSIANLYALGETASTGVHGANRLASNSLLECLVFGAQFAHLQLPEQSHDRRSEVPPSIGLPEIPRSPQPLTEATGWPIDLAALHQQREQLQALMWQSAGICRDGHTMAHAIEQIEQWQQSFSQHPLSIYLSSCQLNPNLASTDPAALETTAGCIPTPQIRVWGEIRNLLEIAELILKSAQFRQESRGGHYRIDYPDSDPDWAHHTIVHKKTWHRSPG